ncbi:MAG: hypothetical protein ACRDYA_13015 [Egibacteraceae bacterium]
MPRLLRLTQLVSLALVALLMLAACGGATKQEAPVAPPAADAAKAEESEKPAEAAITADALRVTLNNVLREHVFLASAATGATLAGDTAGFEAAAKALEEGNSVEFADLMGKIYDNDTREAFLGLWNSHIDMVVAYTNGLAKDDKAAQDKAAADLDQYSTDFAAALEKITGLPATASQPLVAEHVGTLRSLIDKQKAGDVNGAYTDLRTAMNRMDRIAKPLAVQIAKQQSFAGTAEGKAADLQVGLNGLLQEHVFLAGAATAAALAGNTAAFEAAARAEKEGNSVDLANAVKEVYGQDTGDAFLGLWNSHVDMFVSYTTGLTKNDKAAQDKAVTDLTNYVGSLASVFEKVTEGGLPATASSSLIQQHVTTLKTAVDVRKTGNLDAAYTDLREAAHHMRMIADPLAQAIVKQKAIS